jgi:hypothetical protein
MEHLLFYERAKKFFTSRRDFVDCRSVHFVIRLPMIRNVVKENDLSSTLLHCMAYMPSDVVKSPFISMSKRSWGIKYYCSRGNHSGNMSVIKVSQRRSGEMDSWSTNVTVDIFYAKNKMKITVYR